MNKKNENRLILDPPCKFRKPVRFIDEPLKYYCEKGGISCKECKTRSLGYEPMERATEMKERKNKEAAQRIGFRIGQMIVYYSFSVLFLAALSVLLGRRISLLRILLFVAIFDFLHEFHNFCFKNPCQEKK